jgi:hypothetical protein
VACACDGATNAGVDSGAGGSDGLRLPCGGRWLHCRDRRVGAYLGYRCSNRLPKMSLNNERRCASTVESLSLEVSEPVNETSANRGCVGERSVH